MSSPLSPEPDSSPEPILLSKHEPHRVLLQRQTSSDTKDISHEFTETQVEEYREQDRYLPIANVSRIMRDCLPPSAKIAKESKECIQECVSEFIAFVTSEASERCLANKRKTINGEDILEAMKTLGFDNSVEALKIYLAKYRMSQRDKPKQPNSRNRKDLTTSSMAGAKRSRKPSDEGAEEDDMEEDDGEEDGSGMDDEDEEGDEEIEEE